MRRGEWRRIGVARRDPAVSFLLLLPLGLLHLSGRGKAEAGAYAIIEQGLEQLGAWAGWLLAIGLAAGVYLAVLRIQARRIPWRGGAMLLAVEGIVWGLLLGPLLSALTALVSAQLQPLAMGFSEAHGRLALAAGAGLYEELLFRAGLMSALYVLIASFLKTFFPRDAADTFSFGAALVLSAVAFSLAHVLGDPSALDAGPFLFRAVAGVVLGLLFSWRGLAVVAYAHASYDAHFLLSP